MGLFDKVKKAIGGTPQPPSKGSGGGQKSGGRGGQGSQGGGGDRQRGQGGQGGNRQRGQGGQGGQGGGRGPQGGNRNQRGSERADGDAGQSGGSGNRRRGSRGGRNRGGQGGQRAGGEGATATTGGEAREGGQEGAGAGTRRRRRGGRGRGSGSGGGQGGTTRTVTRSNAAELKEQQGEGGSGSGGGRNRGGRSGGQGGGTGQRKKSGSGRSRSGGQGGKQGGGRRRERTRRGSASSGSHRRVLDANERPKDPVKKQILINASDPNEIRVAIREQQKVVEVYVERKGKRSLAGNIYKGRVQNVLRGMEAAFVDIGLERNGFLYVDEITPAAADSDQIMKVSMVTEMEAAPADAPATGEDGSGESAGTDGAPVPVAAAIAGTGDGDDTLDISGAMEDEDREAAEAAAAAEAANGEDKSKDEKSKGRGRARIQNKKKIQELLKPGQEILCQVVKDPMGTKGSRLTTQYSLAGRYLVYVPDGEGLGVSRRLEDAERTRLRDIVKQFELPWGGGLIVRTAAEGALEEDIAKDLQLLLRLHEQLMDKAGQARAPKLLYNEADLSLRIIRDLMNDEVEEVLVDDDRQYQRIMNYLKRTSPILAERVRMHDGQRPLFESYGVEEAIRSTLSKRAELPSGGYLIIDKTEAFHVIDVNTGRNVGTASLEETITKTNMEAAEEVVRQLRLRDLGGIIVCDFIDMNLMKNRDMVLEHFRKELSKDRTKTYLVEISPLGLVEMTRQNVSEGVREILTSTCRSCEGRGVTVSAETHAIEVERALVDLAHGLGDGVEAVAIETQPDVARVLAGNQGKQADLDKRAGKAVRVFGDPDLQPNTFAVRATGDLEKVESLPDPLLRGSKHKVIIDRVDPTCEDDGLAMVDGVLVTVVGAASAVGEERTILIAACAGSRAFATLVKPARRRRRRGGRGRRKATVGVGAVAGANGSEEELTEGEDAFEDGDEGDEDEYEDVEEGEEDEESADPAPAEDLDDERTEIPQRLVMLDGGPDPDDDEGEDGDDDLDDDDDPDDDDDEDDDPDGGDDGDSDDNSDSGSDGSAGGEDGQDDAGDSEDVEDDDAIAEQDETLDAGSFAEDVDSESRPLARRVPADDQDEPSIDAEGGDDLLAARGVEVPLGAPVAAPTADEAAPAPATSGSGASGSASGQPRRRRRGSRGGRNRNRGGANRGGPSQGATSGSDGGAPSAGPTSSSSGDDA